MSRTCLPLLLALAAPACADPAADKADTGVDDTAPDDTDTATDTGDTDTATDTGDTDTADDTADTAPDDTDTGPDDTAAPVTVSASDAVARVHSADALASLGRVLRVGDVDGDGHDDIVAATFQGFGQRGGAFTLPGPVVSGAAQDVGHAVAGTQVGSGLGRSASVGDLDGDGIDDIALGSPYAQRSGLAVVFGPHTGDVSVDDGAFLLGPRSSFAGHGADIGDVNGDGVADAVVGAYFAADSAGETLVAYGPVTGDRDLATADATLTGEPGVLAGRIVSADGDLDGDGTDDIVVACLGALGPPGSGGFYVVHGPVAGDIDLAAADGRYAGEAQSSAGLWLATGDLDGDGRADIVASAFDSTYAESAGAAYVVFGPADRSTILSEADIVVRGDTRGQYGGGVAAGDLDGDGVAELLLGAQGDPTVGASAGAAFLFLDPAPGAYVFGDADVAFYAEGTGDNLGSAVAFGDLDGDGVVEVLLGAQAESTGGSTAGAVYVVDVPE